MNEPDRTIMHLRVKGKSYREIGSILGISHVAVMKRIKKNGNHVVTKKTPYLDMGHDVNGFPEAVKDIPEGVESGFESICENVNDLWGMIKRFLESRGVRLHRMHTDPECYQAKLRGQMIRFYISR